MCSLRLARLPTELLGRREPPWLGHSNNDCSSAPAPSRCFCNFVILEVSDPSIFVIFNDFDDFCKGPVQDFSQNDTFLERCFCVFAIFVEISHSGTVLERCFCIFAISADHFGVIFRFCSGFRDFAYL